MEKVYLEREVGQLRRDKNQQPAPWILMLTSAPVLALIFTQVCDFFSAFMHSTRTIMCLVIKLRTKIFYLQEKKRN